MTDANISVPNYSNLLDLNGRGFVVLGAGTGIGRQCCYALAQAGARIICVDIDPELAQSIAEEVKGIPLAGDITARQDMVHIFETAEKEFAQDFHGIVDVVGIAYLGKLIDMTDEQWDWQHNIIHRHAYYAIQIGGAALAKANGGTIVFISSLSGSVSVVNQVAYGTAKAALTHLVRCAAHELGPQGIRINAVAPSFVKTPRLLQRIPEELWNTLSEQNPLRRVAYPEDIASAVLFLSSNLAAYVTGNVLMLDGGISNISVLPEV